MPRIPRLLTTAALGMTVLVLVGCGPATPAAGPTTPAETASAAAQPGETLTTTVIDQWGRSVEVPVNPDKVVVLEWEGLVAKTLEIIGEADTIVGADPNSLQPFRLSVVPELAKAQNVGSPWSGLNYETIAALGTEVVFLEAWANSPENKEMHQGIIDQIEALGIPVVAMMSPSNFPEATLDRSWEIVDLVGQVYNRQADTDAVIDTVESSLAEVTSRIPELPEADRPEAAIFATTNYLMGPESVQSYLLTDVLKAKNLATGAGAFVPITEEQLLAMNPENLIVIGHEGNLSVDDIRAGTNKGLSWATLKNLSAIQNDRIVDLGYDEWRPTIETPIAMLKIAAMLYPEQFADVDIEQQELRFYQDIYDLSATEAKQAIKNQEWSPEASN